MPDVETFPIARSFITTTKVASWVFVVFAAFELAAPLASSLGARGLPTALSVLLSLGGSVFGVMAWLGFATAKRLPLAAVSIDAEGLWLAHLPRAQALVRWDRVHGLREHLRPQRLDLLDANGNVLLKLEYQLIGFDALREVLLERMPRSRLPALPVVHRRGNLYHLGVGLWVVGFALLGWYLGKAAPLLGYGVATALVAAGVVGYLSAVSRLEIHANHLRVGTPVAVHTLRRDDIAAVRFGDHANQGTRRTSVELVAHGRKKPIEIQGLDVDAVNLVRELREWHRGAT